MMNKNKELEKFKDELAAIIIAAGYSSRMKAFKPLLPFGKDEDETVLEYTVETFLKAGIKNILVVLGYQGDRIEPLLKRDNISYVYNENYDQGMYSSIVAGVKALPRENKGFFLLPVDIPLVKSSTVEKLVEVFRSKEKYIVYPSYNFKKGHPPLIASHLYSDILNFDGQGGLKALLKQYDSKYIEYVTVEDEGVVLDMDYYEEYRELLTKVKE